MSHSLCNKAAGFSIESAGSYAGKTVNFSIALEENILLPSDILSCEWYLDGTLLDNQHDLVLQGSLYCGDHVVAARLLTETGWTGLKSTGFTNCTLPASYVLEGPSTVNEGDTVAFYVFAIFNDGSKQDVSYRYTFTADYGGGFQGQQFRAAQIDGQQDLQVEISARTADSQILKKPVLIKNTSEPPVDIPDFDFMVLRFIWQEGAGRDLDIQVGFENSNTTYDNRYVGYGNPNRTLPENTVPETDAYLWWAKDNTQTTGVEAVLLNIKRFVADHPTSGAMGDFLARDFFSLDFHTSTVNNRLEVGMYAVWYGGSIDQGRFDVELTCYKGGEMQIQESNFVNIGGTEVSSSVVAAQTKRSRPTSINDYHKVGVLAYNKETKQGVLHIYQDENRI